MSDVIKMTTIYFGFVTSPDWGGGGGGRELTYLDFRCGLTSKFSNPDLVRFVDFRFEVKYRCFRRGDEKIAGC